MQVYCVFFGVGVTVSPSNAEWIVVIKTKTRKFLTIKRVDYLRRLFAGEGI